MRATRELYDCGMPQRLRFPSSASRVAYRAMLCVAAPDSPPASVAEILAHPVSPVHRSPSPRDDAEDDDDRDLTCRGVQHPGRGRQRASPPRAPRGPVLSLQQLRPRHAVSCGRLCWSLSI